MLETTDILIGFLFLPVMLFIIIPLIILCSWLLYQLTKPVIRKPKEGEKLNSVDEMVILTG